MNRIIGLLLLIASGAAVAYEEPEYSVIESDRDVEIRRYEPYIVAEVTVDGAMRESGNSAFRVLAGYIFGDNRSDTEMNMTAPVESRESGERMNMTAPVESVDAGDGSYVYAFVMESRYTLETLPVPNDERIRIREVPARTMAVRRFSGGWGERNYERNERALLTTISERGLETVGEPVFARYNGPFTPTFMRRNEVMIQLADPVAETAQR